MKAVKDLKVPESLDIVILGSGYVGLVTGVCLAGTGNRVICTDVEHDRIHGLRQGRVPFYEPRINDLLAENLGDGRIGFTTDVSKAIGSADAVFIAVGTPAREDGAANVEQVLQAATTVATHMKPQAVVVIKSTVPVGTTARVRALMEEHVTEPFHLCVNPEFLREGTAVNDFLYPDRVVCGVDSTLARVMLRMLYEPFVRSGHPILFMDIASAELTKYASNAMLAARVGLMNEIAAVCEATGADIEAVRSGLGSDRRIGPEYLFAGTGFGGSCLPKDLTAFVNMAEECDVDASIARAVVQGNARQHTLLLRKLVKRFGDLTGRRFAIWGLAFKPGTDDMRAAPSRVVINGLLESGALVSAHDPAAMGVARQHFSDREVHYGSDEYEVLRDADALLVMTEWLQYRRPDWSAVRELLAEQIIFDGRNLFDPDEMEKMGFEYYPVGRRQVGSQHQAGNRP